MKIESIVNSIVLLMPAFFGFSVGVVGPPEDQSVAILWSAVVGAVIGAYSGTALAALQDDDWTRRALYRGVVRLTGSWGCGVLFALVTAALSQTKLIHEVFGHIWVVTGTSGLIAFGAPVIMPKLVNKIKRGIEK